CMCNQARVADGATVVSTSTRNFPNRLGTGANVYLSSAELAGVAALIGKLPTPEEYQTFLAQVDKTAVDTCSYTHLRAHERVLMIWYAVFCLKKGGGGGGGGGGG
ncbi:aconitase family protein, partial [Enterobacter hormaechei]